MVTPGKVPALSETVPVMVTFSCWKASVFKFSADACVTKAKFIAVIIPKDKKTALRALNTLFFLIHFSVKFIISVD